MKPCPREPPWRSPPPTSRVPFPKSSPTISPGSPVRHPDSQLQSLRGAQRSPSCYDPPGLKAARTPLGCHSLISTPMIVSKEQPIRLHSGPGQPLRTAAPAAPAIKGRKSHCQLPQLPPPHLPACKSQPQTAQAGCLERPGAGRPSQGSGSQVGTLLTMT